MIHMIKLCVGAEGVDDLRGWQASRFPSGPARHITRMQPKRVADLLDGGSLYWVFKGLVLARQRILALDEITDPDGTRRCAISLDRDIALTEAMPRRPFQGWRYLDAADAPPDLKPGREREDPLPDSLKAALAEIGLR